MIRETVEAVRELTPLKRSEEGIAKKIVKLRTRLAVLHAEEKECGLTEDLEREIDITESLLQTFESIQSRRLRKKKLHT